MTDHSELLLALQFAEAVAFDPRIRSTFADARTAIISLSAERDRLRDELDANNAAHRETGRQLGELKRENDRLKEALPAHQSAVAKFIKWWDSLPVGYHNSREVERWLHDPVMKEFVAECRSALSANESQGGERS
jgi:predicted nuclease with TOPRIM domain